MKVERRASKEGGERGGGRVVNEMEMKSPPKASLPSEEGPAGQQGARTGLWGEEGSLCATMVVIFTTHHLFIPPPYRLGEMSKFSPSSHKPFTKVHRAI